MYCQAPDIDQILDPQVFLHRYYKYHTDKLNPLYEKR